jgi:hypothetical protein
MSKEKKPQVKKVDSKDLTDILTIKEMADLEFKIADMSIGDFTDEQQFQKFIDALKKQAGKYFFKQGEMITKANDNIETLLTYLVKYPELFAEDYDEINRDMIKFFLVKHMDKCREMIDRIQEIEKDLNLDIHQIW